MTWDCWWCREAHDVARCPTPLHRLLERAPEQRVVTLDGRGSQASRPETIVEVVEILRANLAELPPTEAVRCHTASDAAVAMELGCEGVLMNTAIAEAKDPVRMARAMKLAVEAGREAYLAGRMGRRMYADPSSPLAGLI